MEGIMDFIGQLSDIVDAIFALVKKIMTKIDEFNAEEAAE